jgi:hypothetical protein
MDCPYCGLINPDSAIRCDCGYDFRVRSPVVRKRSPRIVKVLVVLVLLQNVGIAGLLYTSVALREHFYLAVIWAIASLYALALLLSGWYFARIAVAILTFPVGLLALSSKTKEYCQNLPRDRVDFDDVGVTRRLPSGGTEFVSWAELRQVMVITTDEGPLLEDVYFMLTGTGDNGCAIPQMADGVGPLVERLVKLPGFDDNKLREAMGCTSNARFVCWVRQ